MLQALRTAFPKTFQQPERLKEMRPFIATGAVAGMEFQQPERLKEMRLARPWRAWSFNVSTA